MTKFSKEQIEKLLSEKYVWLKPPKQVYILKAPIIYPEMHARILGLNPAFERSTILLSSDATEETMVHECVPPTSRVITDSGVKRISDVKVGDKVLDHEKYYHQVTKVMKYRYDGTMYKITTTHINLPIYATPNHPIFVRRRGVYKTSDKFGGKGGYKTGWVFPSQIDSTMDLVVPNFKPNHLSDKKFVDISKYLSNPIISDGFVIKVHKHGPKENKYTIPRRIEITHEFLKLLGWYVAEGNTNKGGIMLSLGKGEKGIGKEIASLIEKIFGVPAEIQEPKGYRGIQIRANSTILSSLFTNWFRNNAHNKRIPYWIMSLKKEYIETFVKAYINGDGSILMNTTRIGNRYPVIHVSTVSESLAYQVYVLLLRCGLVPTLYYVHNGSGFKENSPKYRICIQAGDIDNFLGINTERKKKIKRYAHSSPGGVGYLWLKPKSIEKIKYNGYVYNLEVEHSNSFTTELRVVHNSIHTMGAGEIITRPLAKRLVKFRSRFPPIRKRKVEYEEQEVTSEDLKKFAIASEPKGKYPVKLLKLKKVKRIGR